MTLVFAIVHLYNDLNFLNFLSIDRWNGRRYQLVLALCALFTGVILKGLTN